MTTIVCVRRGGIVAMGGDGQVTFSQSSILKSTAKKVRKLKEQTDHPILTGFAGSTADAFTLLDLFEKKVDEHGGVLQSGAIALAKMWRTDRSLRRLEAVLIVADREQSFMITGNGDVASMDHDILATGSGGNYALAAARALYENTPLGAEEIVRRSLKIASDICVYTNDKLRIETIPSIAPEQDANGDTEKLS